jgi:predicted acylesterase/phospholipase RssA
MPNFHQVLADELNHEILNRPGRESGPAGAVKTADESAISSTAPATEGTEATGTAPDAEDKHPIIGLAFSGGGIRSATFNLGVLQGLAKFRLLRQIDYLSTVSGGGFIGSWLITWIKRTSTKEVQQKLGDYVADPDTGAGSVLPEPEPQEINFLRDYSNYLTPRKGIFGADTWAGIATYFRNVLLNQLVLVAFLGSVLFLPWVAVQARRWVPHCARSFDFLAAVSAALVVFTIVMASYQVALCSRTEKPAPAIAAQPMVLLSVVLPLFLGAISILALLWVDRAAPAATSPGNAPGHGMLFWVGLTTVLYGGAHVLGLVPRWVITRNLADDQKMSPWAWPFIPLFAALAGAAGGLLAFLLARLITYWQGCFDIAAVWYVATFGPPAIILIFLLTGAIHIGLLRLLIETEEQEWWARLGGWLLIWSIGWTGLFALAAFAPLGELYLAAWVKTKFALIFGWILTTVGGLIAGRSINTGAISPQNSPLARFASIAPYVFVVGLLVLLSIGVHEIATHLPIELPAGAPGTFAVRIVALSEPPSVSQVYWGGAHYFPAVWLVVCCGGLFLFSLLLAFRIDINNFSMNVFYRNRIVRCYLGATRPEENRHANPFTGFDPQDDQLLKNFSSQATGPGSAKKYDGPYPLFCAALNVTHGERLAWQERKAESFVFTPRYCGFDFPEMHLIAELPESFRPTYEFAYPRSANPAKQKEIGGMHVGTAMSISGAAASPNMGFHTSPPLAFLMTMFDVRLGWWLPNPRRESEKHRMTPEGGPRLSLFYLLHELFASTTDRSKYVYVSDGGHFENLSIYELVRRRCEFIIACDADADAGMAFNDLGNAIRKCRSDFGVEITIDPTPVRIASNGYAQRHAALGTIRYPKYGKVAGRAQEPMIGKLLYIKTTVTKGVPADVLAYRAQDPSFPDRSTADQWFDESQFESYRRLGVYSIESLLGGEPKQDFWTVKQLCDVVERLQSFP